jgi:hypothetical protein
MPHASVTQGGPSGSPFFLSAVGSTPGPRHGMAGGARRAEARLRNGWVRRGKARPVQNGARVAQGGSRFPRAPP